LGFIRNILNSYYILLFIEKKKTNHKKTNRAAVEGFGVKGSMIEF